MGAGLFRSPAHSSGVPQLGLLEGGEGWTRLDDRVVMEIDSLDAVAEAEALLRVTAQLEGPTH